METTKQHWLVALRRQHDSHEATLEDLAAAVQPSQKKNLADVAMFHVPNLRVGKLDEVMQLSDELQKMDTNLESLTRKTEKQMEETHQLSQNSEVLRSGRSTQKTTSSRSKQRKPDPVFLQVDNHPVEEFLASFYWDHEQWDEHQPLRELANQLKAAAETADRESRAYANAYQEKMSRISNLERSKTGTLMNAELSHVITEEALHHARLSPEDLATDSEYLKTVAIVIPRNDEEQFLKTYEILADDSVPLGPEGNRDAEHGSPAVPRSAVKITSEGEYSLYLITILRKYEEDYRNACKQYKFVIRNFEYDPEKTLENESEIESLKREASSALEAWREDADRKFGEIFSIWMHVKAMRLFVEAVLRYGIPTDYTYAVLTPHKGAEKKLIKNIQHAYKHMDEGYMDEEKEADVPDYSMAAQESALASSLPIIALPFEVKTSVHP